MKYHSVIALLWCMMLKLQAQGTGLHFTLNGTTYLPGDTVHITDIGEFLPELPDRAGSSLVCNTNNVNPQCCRRSDGGNVGEWFFPNGTMIPRNSGNENADFTRSGFTHQVRLNRRNNAQMPTGEYSCRVPNEGSQTLYTANIAVIAVHISIPALLRVNESDGVVSVCARLTITSSASAATVHAINASLATRNGPATAGPDYTAETMEFLFPAGVTKDMHCLMIGIIRDAVLERDETFTVVLNTSDAGTLQNNVTTITIVDFTVSIPDTLRVSEEDRLASVCATLTATTVMNAATSQAIRVLLATNSDTATGGSDYVDVSMELMFPAGLTNGAQQCLNITIVDDTVVEGNETFTVTLTTPDIGVSLENNILTITVADVLASLPASQGVAEDNGIATVCAILSGTVESTQNVVITLYTRDGTALAGSDYIATMNSVTTTTSTHRSEHCLNISIINRDIVEEDRAFDVILTTSDQLLQGNNVATITIVDDDVPSPMASLSLLPGPLVAGGIENATLNCSALTHQATQNQGMIYYNFTWLNRDNTTILSGGRTIISPSSPFFSPSPYSILTLSPLSTMDTNITCTAAVIRVVQNVMVSSEPAVTFARVSVTIPSQPLVEVTHSDGSPVAGNNFTLTCTVTPLDQLREPAVIVWMGPDGVLIGNGTIADATVAQVSPHTGVLTFSPLHTDYGGEYRCRATVDIAEAGVFITNSSTFNITIQIPPPSITIIGSPVDSNFFTGLRLTLTCSIHIPQQLFSQPIQVTAHWTKAGSTLTNNTRVTVGGGAVRVGALLYQFTLTLHSLDGSRGDNGEYTCTGFINTSMSALPYNVVVQTIYFQLEIVGIENCRSWRIDNPSAKDRDLVEALVENVALRCDECDFREDRITDRVFQCFPSSLQSVTYHAQLHGTLNANVSELFTILEGWISSGVTVPLQLLPLTVTRVCSVTSSVPSEPCRNEPTTNLPTQFIATTSEKHSFSNATSETLTSFSTSSEPTTGGAFDLTRVIITASGATAIAIALLVVVITITACMCHRHSGDKDPKTTDTEQTSTAPSEALELNPIPSQSHYDDILDAEKMDTTQCDAYQKSEYSYVTVKDGNENERHSGDKDPKTTDTKQTLTAPSEALELNPLPSQSLYDDILDTEKMDTTKCDAYQKSAEYSYVTVKDGNENEKSGYVNVPPDSKEYDYAVVPQNIYIT